MSQNIFLLTMYLSQPLQTQSCTVDPLTKGAAHATIRQNQIAY